MRGRLMYLSKLKKRLLTIDDIAQRWSEIRGVEVTEEEVLAYGLSGHLRVAIQDGVWNKTDRALEIFKGAKSGGRLFKTLPIESYQLKQICSVKNGLRLKDIMRNDRHLKAQNDSRNRFVTMDCLCVHLSVVERFEQKYFDIKYEMDKTKPTKIVHRRVKVVKQYLLENECSLIENLTLQEVWAELAKMDKELFRPTSNRTIGNLFTLCRKEDVNFPKLSSGLRKK